MKVFDMEDKKLYEMKHCENYVTCATLHDWTSHSPRPFICCPAECKKFLLKEEYKKDNK